MATSRFEDLNVRMVNVERKLDKLMTLLQDKALMDATDKSNMDAMMVAHANPYTFEVMPELDGLDPIVAQEVAGLDTKNESKLILYATYSIGELTALGLVPDQPGQPFNDGGMKMVDVSADGTITNIVVS